MKDRLKLLLKQIQSRKIFPGLHVTSTLIDRHVQVVTWLKMTDSDLNNMDALEYALSIIALAWTLSADNPKRAELREHFAMRKLRGVDVLPLFFDSNFEVERVPDKCKKGSVSPSRQASPPPSS